VLAKSSKRYGTATAKTVESSAVVRIVGRLKYVWEGSADCTCSGKYSDLKKIDFTQRFTETLWRVR